MVFGCRSHSNRNVLPGFFIWEPGECDVRLTLDVAAAVKCKRCGSAVEVRDDLRGVVTRFGILCDSCRHVPLDYKSMPYSEYLKTEHWKAVRKAALQRAGNRCQLNSSHTKRLEVHHNNYDHLGEERPKDVIVLCRDCHSKHHRELPY